MCIRDSRGGGRSELIEFAAPSAHSASMAFYGSGREGGAGEDTREDAPASTHIYNTLTLI
eukprot:9405122-Pyramimonas_sp.AAC.1